MRSGIEVHLILSPTRGPGEHRVSLAAIDWVITDQDTHQALVQ
jgi:hypothetical protein